MNLNLVDRTDPLTELIARKVIEFAQRGERDPTRLLQRTVAEITDGHVQESNTRSRA